MGDIKSGRKTEYFFFTLIILPFIFFFSFNHENRYIFYSWIALCALLWDLLALFFFLLCFFKSVHECLYIKCYKYTCYYFYNKNVSSQLNWYTYKLFRQQNENKMWLMSCVNILMLLFYFISVLLFFLPFFFASLWQLIVLSRKKKCYKVNDDEEEVLYCSALSSYKVSLLTLFVAVFKMNLNFSHVQRLHE